MRVCVCVCLEWKCYCGRHTHTHTLSEFSSSAGLKQAKRLWWDVWRNHQLLIRVRAPMLPHGPRAQTARATQRRRPPHTPNKPMIRQEGVKTCSALLSQITILELLTYKALTCWSPPPSSSNVIFLLVQVADKFCSFMWF